MTSAEPGRGKKAIKTKIFLFIFIFSVIFFYVYLSLPYLAGKSLWQDIEIKNIKLQNTTNEYEIADGILTTNGESRKIKFEINPVKLIDNNRILRLALFYQWQNEDPLLAAPGLDAKAFQISTTRLTEINNAVVKNMNLSSDLLPVKFLSSWGETITKNEEFDKQINFQSAQILIKAELKTADDYGQDAVNLRKKIGVLAVENKAIVQPGSTTTTEIIESDLTKIASNSKTLKKELLQREACLYSFVFCQRAILAPELLPAVEEKSEPESRFLSPKEIYYTKNPEDSEIAGPYQIQTLCWNPDNGEKKEQYLYQITEQSDWGLRLIPKLATNNYYYETIKNSDDPLDIGYSNHDIYWRVVFETTHYNCNDLTYQPRLATLYYYQKTMKTKILADVKDIDNIFGEIFVKAQQAEESFYKDSVPSDNNLKTLGSYYGQLYKIISEKERQGESITPPIKKLKNDLLYRYLLIDRGLADIDGVFNFYSYILDGYSQMTHFNNQGEKDLYVYTARNGYSLFYLGFSQSTWRSSDKLQYVDTTKPQLGQNLIGYQEMINKFGLEFTRKVTDLTREQVWYELLGHYIR